MHCEAEQQNMGPGSSREVWALCDWLATSATVAKTHNLANARERASIHKATCDFLILQDLVSNAGEVVVETWPLP